MNNLFKNLGLNKDNGLFIVSERNSWQNLFPKRIEEFFDAENHPDAFFVIADKPFILFYENPKDKKAIFRRVWNFNESPIIFIIEPDNIEIYNGFKYLENKLSQIDSENQNDFSYFKLITGKTWEKYQNEFQYQNRVDYKLLENIKDTRDILNIENSMANKLIGKCIFTRYLIDRKVKLNISGKSKYLTNDEFVEILKNKDKTIKLFVYFQEKFNGDLFSIDKEDYTLIDQDVFNKLSDLIDGIEIKSGQMSFFDLYDFSIIPVEFISNVYELFIGENEQAEQGAYYTPVFLVDYILSQTVEKYFKDNPKQYNCKILDPACGSGIFLVEAFRKIIKQYENLHPEVEKSSGEYKEALKKLAKDNLFGIDKDDKAISVAAFSIYLTMLHYQTPADIENFKFPELTETNFLEGDFFNKKFNNYKNLKAFNFIIGNPPWKRGSGEEKNPLYLQYIKDRKKEEKSEITISGKEIAQAFLLRTSDFSTKDTKCALIVTSKILYNLKGNKFRKYFLDNYFINKVFELAPVRREIFDKSNDNAIAPAAILFYQYSNNKNTDKNTIEHITLKPNKFFSMFKIFTIQRNDYKTVIQRKLKDDDYLWKILVYGNYLDYNLIKRLKDKDNYKSIANVIDNQEKFLVGQGIMVGGGDKNDISDLKEKDFIDTKKDLFPYFINPELKKWSEVNAILVHRPRNPKLFEAPILLITGGISNAFRSNSAISYKDVVYKSSLTGIKTNNKNISVLKSINGILNSSFFSYFILLTGSSTGSEREEAHDSEKWATPFSANKKVSNLVTEIEELKKSRYEDNNILRYDEIDNEIDHTLKKLDKEVLKSFDLSDEEQAVIDYSQEITIPMIIKDKGYEKKLYSNIGIKSNILKKYIQVFFDRFDETSNLIGIDLTVEIWHNNNFIGLFFKEKPIISNVSNKKIVYKNNQSLNNFLSKISSLGTEKITEQLFIQKDIRGFEEDGFYIIKPNEKRLWHKAIAYLDMYEFVDAILRAGMETYNNE